LFPLELLAVIFFGFAAFAVSWLLVGFVVNSVGVAVLLACSWLSVALFLVFCFGFMGVCSPSLICFWEPVPSSVPIST
jgi:hypothetical protein